MTIGVCVAGATGWAGRPIAEAVLAAEDLALRSAVSRSAAEETSELRGAVSLWACRSTGQWPMRWTASTL